MALLTCHAFHAGLRPVARAGRVLALAACAAAIGVGEVRAGESVSLEDAVKATFILKFAPFVTWPASAQKADSFDICTEGDDNVSGYLPQAAQGQNVDGRRVEIRALTAGQAGDDCRIVYIASGAEPGPALDRLHAKPVLTVTQSGDGPHGVIQLLKLGNHVSFDIDAKLASDDGLTISSKLLALAHSVTPAGGQQ